MNKDQDTARTMEVTRGPWAQSNAAAHRPLRGVLAESEESARGDRDAFKALGDLLEKSRPPGNNASLLVAIQRRLTEEDRFTARVLTNPAGDHRSWPALLAASAMFAACLAGLALIPGTSSDSPSEVAQSTSVSAVTPWIDEIDVQVTAIEVLLVEFDAPVSIAGEFETLSESIASTAKELDGEIW